VKVLSRLSGDLFRQASSPPTGRTSQVFVVTPRDNISAFKGVSGARRQERFWVVYAKRPFGGPRAVLADLSRYTHGSPSPIAA